MAMSRWSRMRASMVASRPSTLDSRVVREVEGEEVVEVEEVEVVGDGRRRRRRGCCARILCCCCEMIVCPIKITMVIVFVFVILRVWMGGAIGWERGCGRWGEGLGGRAGREGEGGRIGGEGSVEGGGGGRWEEEEDFDEIW